MVSSPVFDTDSTGSIPVVAVSKKFQKTKKGGNELEISVYTFSRKDEPLIYHGDCINSNRRGTKILIFKDKTLQGGVEMRDIAKIKVRSVGDEVWSD